MAQPPRLERLEQTAQFDHDGEHFLLIVPKPFRRVVGNGIVLLAHVSEHAHQSLALRRTNAGEGTLLGCHLQAGKHAAMVLDETMAQIAPPQFSQFLQKVWWKLAAGQCCVHRLQFMGGNQMQKGGPCCQCQLRRLEPARAKFFSHPDGAGSHRTATLALHRLARELQSGSQFVTLMSFVALHNRSGFIHHEVAQFLGGNVAALVLVLG